jgi:ribonucleoside-diphosphate reductase alpha chain
MGMTKNKEIPMVKSFMDYMGRWLALKFLPKEKAKRFHNGELIDKAYAEGSKSKDAFAMSLPVIDEGASVFSATLPFTAEDHHVSATDSDDPQAQAKLQGFTGSMCSGCGSFKMKRNGSCELCLDCGATSGCS